MAEDDPRDICPRCGAAATRLQLLDGDALVCGACGRQTIVRRPPPAWTEGLTDEERLEIGLDPRGE